MISEEFCLRLREISRHVFHESRTYSGRFRPLPVCTVFLPFWRAEACHDPEVKKKGLTEILKRLVKPTS